MNAPEPLKLDFDLDDWKIAVDSMSLGDMTLYHAFAYNEKTHQVIEGDVEHPDEEYVRRSMEDTLRGTLMMRAMHEQMQRASAPAEAEADADK